MDRDTEQRLAASNKAAKAFADNNFGPRSYPDFRAALAGRKSKLSPKDLQRLNKIRPQLRELMLDAERLRDQIWVGYQNMVRRIAKKIARYESDIEDLYSEGLLFLEKAIFGYSNPKFRFMTYAYNVVQKELKREYLSTQTISSHSSMFHDLIRKFESTEEELLKQEIRPTVHNIAEYGDIDVADLLGITAIALHEKDDTEKNHQFELGEDDEQLITLCEMDGVEAALSESSQEEKSLVAGLLVGKSLKLISEEIGLTPHKSRAILKKFFDKVRSKEYVEAA